MNNPTRETDEVQGAGVYSSTPPSAGTDSPPLGTPGTSSVRVYDRPDSPQNGMNITTIVLMLIALLIISAIVWSVIT